MPKSTESKSEESFVNLMMVAAEFAASRGGIEPAKLALNDAGRFIAHAGSVEKASRALNVLESLKSKIWGVAPEQPPKEPTAKE